MGLTTVPPAVLHLLFSSRPAFALTRSSLSTIFAQLTLFSFAARRPPFPTRRHNKRGGVYERRLVVWFMQCVCPAPAPFARLTRFADGRSGIFPSNVRSIRFSVISLALNCSHSTSKSTTSLKPTPSPPQTQRATPRPSIPTLNHPFVLLPPSADPH